MKILFLTLLDFDSVHEHNIYTDLLREFIQNKHEIFVISPIERKKNEKTHFVVEESSTILKLRIGNIQKTNVIEKGISTILLESTVIKGIKKYFSDVKFDLVLYSTPPITLQKAVAYVKKRDNAFTYLMLKDIFPQNAIDIGIISKKGLKSVIYKFFRSKEKELYKLSDHIGCMSQANCDYLLRNNNYLNKNNVSICPNCIDIIDMRIDDFEKEKLRTKYGIPLNKKVFIYGGNLGRPQDISYIIKCLKSQLNVENKFFLIVGDGTEFSKLESFFSEFKPKNMKLMKRLPKEDYDKMIASCDIGLIFLDHRFTIPNFPSRLLSYMQAGLPVLACTDSNTDIGKVIVNGEFGWWCESSDEEEFSNMLFKIDKENIEIKKSNSYKYLVDNYSSKNGYNIIMRSINNRM